MPSRGKPKPRSRLTRDMLRRYKRRWLTMNALSGKSILTIPMTIRLTEADSDFAGYATAAFDYFANERLRTGLSQENTDTIIDLLRALPHGVARMSPSIPGLVETSNNLAIVESATVRSRC